MIKVFSLATSNHRPIVSQPLSDPPSSETSTLERYQSTFLPFFFFIKIAEHFKLFLLLLSNMEIKGKHHALFSGVAAQKVSSKPRTTKYSCQLDFEVVLKILEEGQRSEISSSAASSQSLRT